MKKEKSRRKSKNGSGSKKRPKGRGYFAWLVFVICLIYMTDEIASQIGTLMKTEIATDLLSRFGESGVVVPFQPVCLVYRPLADRFGRKIFLVANTLGMSLSMLLIFLSGSLWMYMIGTCLIRFFIPHDMHVVYIMETAPEKHRARVYTVIKFFANMGVMLVPLLRRCLMQEMGQWRRVYLIPALIGLVFGFIALLFARETDSFIASRLKILKMTDKERMDAKKNAKSEIAEGGFFEAVRFAFSHKQLKWLYITSAFANLGTLLVIEYQVILTYGYANHFLGKGVFETLSEAVSAASAAIVTEALFFFAIGSALARS